MPCRRRVFICQSKANREVSNWPHGICLYFTWGGFGNKVASPGCHGITVAWKHFPYKNKKETYSWSIISWAFTWFYLSFFPKLSFTRAKCHLENVQGFAKSYHFPMGDQRGAMPNKHFVRCCYNRYLHTLLFGTCTFWNLCLFFMSSLDTVTSLIVESLVMPTRALLIRILQWTVWLYINTRFHRFGFVNFLCSVYTYTTHTHTHIYIYIYISYICFLWTPLCHVYIPY